MQPTMKLRWDQCLEPLPHIGDGICRYVKVLQQWHEHTVSIPIDGVVTEQVVGEWRDVPIEVEA